MEQKGDKSGKNVKDVGLDPMQDLSVIPSEWPLEFERQQRLILELWETCNVSLVHRTYFFLLFKGDPMDSIYMEVEVRRLSFLKEKFSGRNPTMEDGQTLTLASRFSLSLMYFVRTSALGCGSVCYISFNLLFTPRLLRVFIHSRNLKLVNSH